ncbi:MAG: hypothetical protein RI575_13885, partial [Balneolaceae bacterium]|nr:hypothetical protein [Balneolaceae bacterium]
SPLLINSNLLREVEQVAGTRSNLNLHVLYHNEILWCRTSCPAYIVQRAASPLLINSILLREVE